MQNLREPLSDDDLDRLDGYLRRVDGGAIPNIEALDGFITALAICPELVQPSEFLDVIQKGKKADLVFENMTEANEFMGLVMRHWNHVNATYGKEQLYLPILLENEEGVSLCADWASGFYEATRLRKEVWADILQDEDRGGGMVAILALYYQNHPDPEVRPFAEPITAEKRDELRNAMIAGAFQLYRAFRQKNRLVTSPVRARSAKIGPNAPCPCGSGKKFKKCCGSVTIH